MKKIRIIVIALLMTIVSGCGKEQEEVVLPSLPIVEVNQSSEEEVAETPLVVYGSNETADGLVSTEVMVSEISPEIILEELTKMGNITGDTTVRGFFIQEKENNKIIDLNLSKEYEEAISTMGSSGEYLSIAALVNTFIGAYQGDRLVLNIAGSPLETGHNTYEEAFLLFPMDRKVEAKGYEITQEIIEEENSLIKYPKIVSTEGESEKFQKWNDFFKKVAIGDYTTEGRENYQIDYQVMTEDELTISVLFKGEYLYEGFDYPSRFARTVTIDLTTDSSIRLKNYVDMERVVAALETGSGFNVISSDVTNEELKLYLSWIEDLPIVLFDYDYDISNVNFLPEGYSYIKNNRPVIIMSVPHEMGDYVEIEIE